MVVLGVVALGLCSLQLGPILLGGRLDDAPPKKPKHEPGQSRVAGKRKNGGKAKRAVSKGRPPRGRKLARVRPPQPRNTGSNWDLESIVINLDATSRRTLVYSAATLRNPFAAPTFEKERAGTSLTKANFTLDGIVRARNTRPNAPPIHLAIIDGRVYAAGDELAKGIRVVAVDAASVVLAEGKSRARLSMAGSSVEDLRR